MPLLRNNSRWALLAALGAAVALPVGAAALVLTGGVASATSGSLGVAGGTLTMTTPSTLTWSATLGGLDQALVDGNSGDQSYTVTDATGSGTGWNVNAAATTFTCTSTPAAGTCKTGPSTYNEQYLPTTYNSNGIFWTNGSTASSSATTAPSVACYSGSTCTLPTNATTYPVYITPGTAGAAGASVKVLDSAAQTGLGEFNVTSVGWWVEVPANTYAGTYTSTVTISVSSGP